MPKCAKCDDFGSVWIDIGNDQSMSISQVCECVLRRTRALPPPRASAPEEIEGATDDRDDDGTPSHAGALEVDASQALENLIEVGKGLVDWLLSDEGDENVDDG